MVWKCPGWNRLLCIYPINLWIPIKTFSCFSILFSKCIVWKNISFCFHQTDQLSASLNDSQFCYQKHESERFPFCVPLLTLRPPEHILSTHLPSRPRSPILLVFSLEILSIPLITNFTLVCLLQFYSLLNSPLPQYLHFWLPEESLLDGWGMLSGVWRRPEVSSGYV